MQLYLTLTSPYSRKVRILLIEKGITVDEIDVAATGRQSSDYNPLAKVPTLVLDDGTALFDSTVITETIDELFPWPRLIPQGPLERAVVRRWESIADGICDVTIPVVVDARRNEDLRDVAYTTKLVGKAKTALSHIEAALSGKTYLFGESFTLADVAVVSALGYVGLRRPELLEGHPEIARYVTNLLERPSIRDTAPPNLPLRL